MTNARFISDFREPLAGVKRQTQNLELPLEQLPELSLRNSRRRRNPAVIRRERYKVYISVSY